MSEPRYPDIRLCLDSRNPLVWVSEVRTALRRFGVPRDEIQQFSTSALTVEAADDVRRVCNAWAAFEAP